MQHKIISDLRAPRSFPIRLTRSRMTHLIEHGSCRIPFNGTALHLHFKQERLERDTDSFQLICTVNGTFAGYCFMHTKNTALLFTTNQLSAYPERYAWHDTLSGPALEQIRYYNDRSAAALRVDDAYRHDLNSHCTGIGTLLFTCALLLSARLYPLARTLYLEATAQSIPFYERALGLNKAQSGRLKEGNGIVLDHAQVLKALQRTVTIQLVRP